MSTKKPPVPMTSELQEKYETIRGLMSEEAEGGARLSYRVGVEVRSIKEDVGRYGRNSVKILAAGLGRTAACFYAYATVAKVWNPTDFEALVSRRNSEGLPLTFSHFVELAKERSLEERKALLERAFDESLSVRALERDVAGRRRRASTRTPTTGMVVGRLIASSKVTLEAAEHEHAELEQAARTDVGGRPTPTQLETAIETYRKLREMNERICVRLELLLAESHTASPSASRRVIETSGHHETVGAP